MENQSKQMRSGLILAFVTTSVLAVVRGPSAAGERRLGTRIVRSSQAIELGPQLLSPALEGTVGIPEAPGIDARPSNGGGLGQRAWQNDEHSTRFDNFLEPERLAAEQPFLTHKLPLLRSSGTWLWRGHWYTDQAFVTMFRVPPREKFLSREAIPTGLIDPVSGQPVFNNFQDPLTIGRDPYPAEAGVRLTLGNIIGRDDHNNDYAIEFTFLGLLEFTAQDAIQAIDPALSSGLLVDPDLGPKTVAGFNLVGFDRATFHEYLYESDLNSYELNFRFRTRLDRDRVLLQPNGVWVRHANHGRIVTIKGGIRVVSLNEHFRFEARGAGLGLFDAVTHNDLVGIQFGGGMIEQYSKFRWGVRANVAGLYNFADRVMFAFAVDPQDAVARDERDVKSDEQVALLGEVGFHAAINVRPHVTLKVAYELMYLTGIATGRSNISLVPVFRDFNVQDDVVFHSLNTGFEIVW